MIAESTKPPIPGDGDIAGFGTGIVDVPMTSAELSSASGVPKIVIAGFPTSSVEPATTTPSGTEESGNKWPPMLMIDETACEDPSGAVDVPNFWTVEVLSTESPFECGVADIPGTSTGSLPGVIFCESTRTKSPEGGAWILCPSTVVANKAAGALLTARLAEGGKNLWTVEVSTKSPFERRATDMPDTIATLSHAQFFVRQLEQRRQTMGPGLYVHQL